MKNSQWYYQPQSAIGTPETVGPLSLDEFTEAVSSGKVKKRSFVNSPTATKGQWVKASDIAYVREVWAFQKAERSRAEAQAAEEREAKRRRGHEFLHEEFQQRAKAAEDWFFTDCPERFVGTCNNFIQGIRIMGWIAVFFTVVFQIGAMMLAHSSALRNPDPQAYSASYLIGIFTICVTVFLGYCVIELSVLSLRFMKMVVLLLNYGGS